MNYNSEYPSELEIETLEFEASVESNIIVGSGDFPYYEGDYIVDPRKVSVVLPTRNRALVDDVVVKPIYRLDTENQSGGVTVTIGLE